MVTIKISKFARGGLAKKPCETGSVTFGAMELEAMALKLYMLSEHGDTDKFEYSAKLEAEEI